MGLVSYCIIKEIKCEIVIMNVNVCFFSIKWTHIQMGRKACPYPSLILITTHLDLIIPTKFAQERKGIQFIHLTWLPIRFNVIFYFSIALNDT